MELKVRGIRSFLKIRTLLFLSKDDSFVSVFYRYHVIYGLVRKIPNVYFNLMAVRKKKSERERKENENKPPTTIITPTWSPSKHNWFSNIFHFHSISFPYTYLLLHLFYLLFLFYFIIFFFTLLAKDGKNKCDRKSFIFNSSIIVGIYLNCVFILDVRKKMYRY